MDKISEAIFLLWRYQMRHEGYGSYTEIEWAVDHHVLTTFSVPSRWTKGIRKWFIRTFGPGLVGEGGE